MDERVARQAQERALAIRTADNAVATDVQDGIKKALTTHSPNPFAMVFEGQDAQGKKVVSAYVKKAGRSVMLNEVAKKKGGIALLRSICVRASWETKEDLLAMITAMPADMRAQFLESRGNDYRALSLPPRHALYKYVVLFRSGERWEGEGIAHPGNIKATQLHSRIDEMAETRAFMRCVGRGLADGFISPDQAAGSDFYDAAEAELLAEDQGIESEVIEGEGAAPDGADPFRSPESGGAAPGGPGTARQGEPPTGHSAEAGSGAGDDDEPFPAGGQGGNWSHDGDSDEDEGDAPRDISLKELIDMAKAKNIYLLKFVQEEVGLRIERLSQMSDFERSIVASKLEAAPEKVAR